MALPKIEAGLTDLAREYQARSEVEGLVVGDWSFQVGTDGFDPLNPSQATPVDYAQQALTAPVGGNRYLGRVLASGSGAAVTVTSGGFIQVSGLASIPTNTGDKWLVISGSADPALNGTWVIGQYVSSTEVVCHNPLATNDDVGPLNWELREAVVLRPNPSAMDLHGRLASTDATVDGLELGQVGIFCRVLSAPTDLALVGSSLLWAVAHHPAQNKFSGMVLNHHICVQM